MCLKLHSKSNGAGVSTHVDWDQLFVTIVTKLLHYLYAGKNFTQISVASVITEIAKH